MTDAMPEDLVIAAYGAEIPCLMSLTPEGCEERARFLVQVLHSDDGTIICNSPKNTPLCEQHKRIVASAFVGFFADLRPPTPCSECGRKLTLGEIKPINASS